MSALSMATSVPVPMAMPTSAAASAGASLTPSPAMATTRPSAWKRRTISAFCSGRTSAITSSRPSVRATARAVAALSPVTMTTRRPSRLEIADRPARARLDGIRDAEEAHDRVARDQEHHGLPFLAQGLRALPELARVEAQLLEEARVAERHAAARGLADHAAPGERAKRVDRARRHAALGGGGQDGGGQRMLAAALEPGGQGQDLGVGHAVGGDHRDEARLAFGERARLVHEQRIDLLERLERLRVLDQHARLGAAAGRRP